MAAIAAGLRNDVNAGRRSNIKEPKGTKIVLKVLRQHPPNTGGDRAVETIRQRGQVVGLTRYKKTEYCIQ